MNMLDVREGPVTLAVHERVVGMHAAMNAPRLHWLAAYYAADTVGAVRWGSHPESIAESADCAIYADRLARFAELAALGQLAA
jgi:hypothetical protein